MLKGLFGTKIGMTQIFDENRNVIPVTVVGIGDWFVTQVKTKQNEGYSAVQIGLLKKRYKDKAFSQEWLRLKNKFFACVREVEIDEAVEKDFSVGKEVKIEQFALKENEEVAISGTSKSLGFQGVVKRWGFGGGPKAHGSTFHRAPGSIGCMATQGNVMKGQKLPGRCGGKRVTMKGLHVVRIDQEGKNLFVKGAVPGKKDSLLFIRRQG